MQTAPCAAHGRALQIGKDNAVERMDWKNTVDALAGKWDVSAAVTAWAGDTVLYNAVYGYADRSAGRALRPQQRYCFSITSDLLLGLGALLLMDEGVLRPNDRLDRYLPEYRYAGEITVRNLFRRESGIPECISARLIPKIAEKGLPDHERIAKECACKAAPPTFEQALAWIGEKPLEYAPGTDCDFTDAEPLFMLRLLESAAGRPLFELLRERVFVPLGMTHTTAGAQPDCMPSVRDAQEVLVPLPAPPDDNAFTTTHEDLCLLLEAMQARSIVSERTWRQALRYNRDGQGMGFENVNGLVCAELEHPYGYEAYLLFDRKAGGLRYAVTANEVPYTKRMNGQWLSFRPELRAELQGAFATPTAPKLVRYSVHNAMEAMALELAPGQERFVADARTCIGWAYANAGSQRTYVLMDEGRVIGLLVLTIVPKKKRFEIADVLIDRRYQGRGYGKIMLKMGLDILKRHGAEELTLYCVRDNVAAMRLYESVGFVPEALYAQVQRMRCRL